MSDSKNRDKNNLAFVFPPELSKRIKRLQKDMASESAGEVLIKAISLLELSLGRKLEISEGDNKKWEVDEFSKHQKAVEIRNS